MVFEPKHAKDVDRYPSRQLRCVHIRTADIGHAIGCAQRAYWVRIEIETSHRRTRAYILSTSAVLASFLLKEELGHIGRVGCTLCLLGSLIIVLHAPEDKEIATVDEILHFALQPGEYSLPSVKFNALDVTRPRFYVVLPHGCCVQHVHDFRRRSPVWTHKSRHLHLHLLPGWLRFGHVDQRLRCCSQTHLCREQPIHTPEHLCVWYCDRHLYIDSDELLQ